MVSAKRDIEGGTERDERERVCEREKERLHGRERARERETEREKERQSETAREMRERKREGARHLKPCAHQHTLKILTHMKKQTSVLFHIKLQKRIRNQHINYKR